MAEPTPNPSKTNGGHTSDTPTPPEPPAPNNGDNQKAIDEAIAKAKAEWEKEVEEKLKKAEEEGMRKAKLTNEQRKKRTTTRNEKNLKKQRRSLNVKKISCICRKQELAKVGLSCRDCKVHCSRGQG